MISPPVAVAADRYLAAMAALDPAVAQVCGTDVGPVALPDYSPEAFQARRDLAATTTAELAAIPQPERDTLHEAMSERLSADIALYDSGFTPSLLAPLATPVHRLREVFDDLPDRTEADWQVIVPNLEAAAAGYRDYGRTLLAAAGRGQIAAARQVSGVAADVESWLDPGGVDFYRRLAQRVIGGPALRRRLDAAVTDVKLAATNFVATLRTELLPSAPSRDGVGAERYLVTASAFLGRVAEPAQSYEFGWSEVARLTMLAQEVARRLTGSDDLPAARAALDRRPDGTVSVGPELLSWLQDRLDSTRDVLHPRHFDIPERWAPVQAVMVTAGSGVMYYTPADPAGTRPARVWWSVPSGTQRVPTWREVSTVHHEGMPGHHLQHAVAAGTTGLHPWQRHCAHVHGYHEGWAHYAEKLAADMGLVRDDAELMGVLDAQLWRAVRVVVDLGLHLDLPIPRGAFPDEAAITRWTPQVGARLLTRAAGVDPRTAAFEVQRYLGWPGQALAFAVGARVIEDLRDQWVTRPGFDLQQFHRRLLTGGPMGLGPLSHAMLGTRETSAGAAIDSPARDRPADASHS